MSIWVASSIDTEYLMEGGRREGAADAMVSDIDAVKENVATSSF